MSNVVTGPRRTLLVSMILAVHGQECPRYTRRVQCADRNGRKGPLRLDLGLGISRTRVSAPHNKQKQMRLGPATQAALFTWISWPAVSRPKAIDDRCVCTRESASAPRCSPEACAHRLLAQRFHPALVGGFLRRPQRPGSSSLDMNRISPGDSPSRESPATLNRTGKVQNITRF